MKIKRRNQKGSYFTKDCVYETRSDGRIKDDHGTWRKPHLPQHSKRNSYWEILPEEEACKEERRYVKRRAGFESRFLTTGKIYPLTTQNKILDDKGNVYHCTLPQTEDVGASNAWWKFVAPPEPLQAFEAYCVGDVASTLPMQGTETGRFSAAEEKSDMFDALRFAQTGMIPLKDPTILGFDLSTEEKVKMENPTTSAVNQERSLEIRKTTLINGRDCDQFGFNTLLEMIEEEESKIARLNKTLAGSKAISKLTKQHQANVVALIKIIDARPVA